MKIFLYPFILFSVNIASAQEQEFSTKELTVHIENIKAKRKGQIIVFVFREPGFPKQHSKALLTYIYPVSHDQVQVKINVPSQNEFALKVLHDENMDKKVTKNWTGFIPYDGLGFSNGARINFTPPNFNDAKIIYQKDLSPIIRLQYF